MKRLPPYLAAWFFGIMAYSVFVPLTLGVCLKTLAVVMILFLIFNFKTLTTNGKN